MDLKFGIYIPNHLGQFNRYSDGLRTGQPGFNSRQGQQIFLFSTAPRPNLGPTQFPSQWILRTLASGVKRQRREADHSPPPNAELKDGGALPPLSPYFFMAWCLIHCAQGQFYLYLKIINIATQYCILASYFVYIIILFSSSLTIRIPRRYNL
jgi:hypothetical protein